MALPEKEGGWAQRERGNLILVHGSRKEHTVHATQVGHRIIYNWNGTRFSGVEVPRILLVAQNPLASAEGFCVSTARSDFIAMRIRGGCS